jgi:hypothetical protein
LTIFSIKELFSLNRCLKISFRDMCNTIQGGMRMKKVLAVLLAGFMFLGIGSVVMAATDTSNVQVTVAEVDALVVTDGGTISLTTIVGNDLSGPDDTTATLSYTTNSANPRQITAVVEAPGMPAGTQDITLTAAVAGGAGTVTLVNAGTRNATPQVVRTGITAGAISNAVVTYGAHCTASGTVANTYTFVVTYTSLDA